MKLGIFVPGRLNSQRLPNKLILPIGDSCLWDIALKKLSNLPYEKVALCNDKQLIDTASKYDNIDIIVRSDDTKIDGKLNHIFRDIDKMKATHVMFFNPCLPFLEEATITLALKYFEARNLEYLESVVPFRNWVFDENGRPVNKMDYTTLSTKTIKTWYMDANAFRIFNKKQFLETGKMLDDGFGIYPITKMESFDIDTKEDYIIVKAIYEGVYHE